MNKIITRRYSNGKLIEERVDEVSDEQLAKIKEFFDKISAKKREVKNKFQKRLAESVARKQNEPPKSEV